MRANIQKMQPRDGVAADAWCLTDDRDESVLLYSLSGESIHLAQVLRGRDYTGFWFDPRTGATQPAAGPFSGEIRKPGPEPCGRPFRLG